MGRIKLYRYFKQQKIEISFQKVWTCLWKGNGKRKTESLLIAAIRTYHVKAKICSIQQNSMFRLCGDRSKGLIILYANLTSKRKGNMTIHDWAGKLSNRELCKKLKFDQTVYIQTKILPGEIIIWYFDIQTDYLIPTRGFVQAIFKKKITCHIVDFAVQVDYRMKIKTNKSYLDFTRGVRKQTHESNNDINIIGALGMVPKSLEKGAARGGIRGTNRDNLNYSW